MSGAGDRGLQLGAGRLAALWMAFAGVLFQLYRPALRGEFISDDIGYLTTNSWIHRMHFDDVLAILDPWGGPASYTSNWAPANLLLHGLEWQLFGTETFGYHAVNVCLHALVTVLLIPVFVRAGIPALAALLASVVFLLHPANVEAVAWITQLKTLVSTALALGALLMHRRRPALAAALFLLALLTKATAFFVLPVALYWAFAARRAGSREPQREGWLAVWVLLFVAFLVPQFIAFFQGNAMGKLLDPDVFVHVRTMGAIGARYLAMALTGMGTAPFHQPPLAVSMVDPWWLASLAASAVILARLFVTLRRVDVEAGFWLWAAFAYAPISQVFTFLYPMGDRYLYDVLPGLLGAGMLAGREAVARLDARRVARGAPALARPTLSRVGVGLTLVLALFFAVRTRAQAQIWSGLMPFLHAAAEAYPDGMTGHLLRGQAAALRGDNATAVAELRASSDQGFDRFLALSAEPSLAGLRDDPGFQELMRDLAGEWIEIAKERGFDSQPELRVWGEAHQMRGEHAEAVAKLEQALARGGPTDDAVRAELARARDQLAAQERAAARRASDAAATSP